MTFLEAVLIGYLASKRRMNIVQVGANDERLNDPIFPFVMRNRIATRILLVEPQQEIIPFLRANYGSHPDATVHVGAIGTGDALHLYRVKPALWNAYNPPYMKDAPAYRVPSGFASASIQHVRDHATVNPRVDVPLDDCIERISVPCTTLHALISRLSWGEDVDFPQVDAEGADDEVIFASDTDRLKPKVINYETTHLGPERRQRLEAFLMRQGYTLMHWSRSDSIAILQS